MNIEQTLRSLKQTSHDSLAEKIETEYPITWNEERIFQQSYRRYLAQNITTEPIMPAERRYTRWAKFAGLAACLLVTIGLSIGVWSKHQKIETRPPQETQTTTITQTETRTETTAQVTTESQTTGKQTEGSTKKPETTAIPIQSSDRVQPSESAAAPTAFQTETAASAAPQTDAAEVGTRQTTPLAASTHTALPQTSVTAKIQGQIAPITEQSTTNMPTNPATTTVIITTTLPRTDPTETSRPTEPLQTDTTEPAHTSKPIETTATVQPSHAPGYEERYDLLPGFRVVIKGEELTTIYSIDPVSSSPSEIYAYVLDSERFSIQSIEQDSHIQTRYHYDIYDDETHHQITLLQKRRDEFISSFYRKGKLEPQVVGDYSGYWIYDSLGTRLVWDDGKYTFELSGPNEYKELFLPVAESLQPSDLIL